ncbi:Alpha-amylase [Trichinella sp. T9]|nr:Alpha-amylase [Trichinella sp. T9]
MIFQIKYFNNVHLCAFVTIYRQAIQHKIYRKMNVKRACEFPLFIFSTAFFYSYAFNSECFKQLAVDPTRQLVVHLFEWGWTDIAKECKNYLWKSGIGAVQVSPPNEHIIIVENNDLPWWSRYQPISYQLYSRSGSEKEFINMVEECNKYGIRIIADIVINHMVGANMEGYGWHGSYFKSTPFEEYFPSVPYNETDFHDKICNGNIEDYGNRWQVRNCRLVNLVDLDHSNPNVQASIVAYMNRLIDIGVAGFRIDAAKHMWPDMLRKIIYQLKPLNSAYFPKNQCPFIFNEVIDQGGEPIKAEEYLDIGRVTNFKYGLDLSAAVRRRKNFKHLINFGEAWNYFPSNGALVFVDNHDNQRGHGGGGPVLTFKNGNAYKMAVHFMLAWSYGLPRLMSSYYFNTANQGPPSTGFPFFNTTSPMFDRNGKCIASTGWTCEHRWPSFYQMSLFHQNTSNKAIWNTVVDEHRIAFSKGNSGFFALNNHPTENWILHVNTGLPPGYYCDHITGNLNVKRNSCSGKTVFVNPNGWIDLLVRAEETLAISSKNALSKFEPSYRRTLVFVKKKTQIGEYLFMRGRRPSSDSTRWQNQWKNKYTIPIVHVADYDPSFTDYHQWKQHDNMLQWSLPSSKIALKEKKPTVENLFKMGSPLIWTTDNKRSNAYNIYNRYGAHYWMLDVMMDCSKTENDWFEFHIVKQDGEMEKIINIKQCENAYLLLLGKKIKHHLARCGYVNIVEYGMQNCTTDLEKI